MIADLLATLSVAHDPDEDVADSRDFLLGADHGGLVVHTRAFSEAVWTLNAEVYPRTSLRVRDLPASARALVGWAGDEARLADVCTWHARGLRARMW